MIKIDIVQAKMDSAVNEAQRERVVLTRGGKPVALLIGVEGLDEEQLQLGSSDKFWRLLEERRGQKAISRIELEKRIRSAKRNKN